MLRRHHQRGVREWRVRADQFDHAIGQNPAAFSVGLMVVRQHALAGPVDVVWPGGAEFGCEPAVNRGVQRGAGAVGAVLSALFD